MAEPDQTGAFALLSFTRNAANEQLIRFLNGLTTNALRQYPEAEVQSWPYQKAEAEAVIAAGEDATLAMAPFLHGVCFHHYGAASNAERLAQVKNKAAVVLANSNAWIAASQFVNGLRARTQDAIDAATDPIAVNDALQAAMLQAEAFRQGAGM